MTSPPTRPAVLSVALLPLALTACAPPAALRPTLAVQRDAIARVAEAIDADYALLADQARANLATYQRLLLGAAHRELIERGHLTPALEPDTEAFDNDLANPEAQTTLLNEVRLGRLSRENAHAFLHDYALAMRMRREGTPLRDAMLTRLRPLEDAEQRGALVTAAIHNRRDAVLNLLGEAAQVNHTLTDNADRALLQPDPRSLLNVTNPQEQSPAQTLLRQLLTTPPQQPIPPATTSPTTGPN